MFTETDRRSLREHLISRAKDDHRLVGVALTGSASMGREDQWSDVDIAVGVRTGFDLHEVIRDWTDHIGRQFDVVDHLDVHSRGAVYRVFLMSNTLQVDMAFAPEVEFGAVGNAFRLVSGSASEQPPPSEPDVDSLIGLAWLYSLHARSSIARGKRWQAEYMISALRNQVVMLACVRRGVEAHHGRGVDELPEEFLTALESTLVTTAVQSDLIQAFGQVSGLLFTEIEMAKPGQAQTFVAVLEELVRTSDPDAP